MHEHFSAPAPTATPAPVPAAPVIPSARPTASEGEGAGDASQGGVREFVFGGSTDEILRYRGSLHPEDSRLNLIEISAGPAFIYNASESSSWYRHYYTAGPGFTVDARIWFTPFFGLNSSYASTFGGHVQDSVDGSSNAAITHQWFSVGLQGRRYFGLTRLSPSLLYQLDYREYQMRVPADNQMRGRLKTAGPALSLEAELPKSVGYSWTAGFEFAPRGRHQEISTGLDLKSGGDNETNTVGFSGGGKFRFSRSSVMYWKVSYIVEKNLFSGDATQADPISGDKPSGVYVTNSFTIFQMGYTWGN